MKIKGRKNYKPGPKDECGTPPYAIIPLISHIERYRKKIGVPKDKFVILEPACGLMEKRHFGLVDGISKMGYPAIALSDYDFVDIDIDWVMERYNHYGRIQMIVTNPPFSVALKRRFIETCRRLYESAGIPFALLMGSTTLVEKVNGKTLRGCAIHIPYGRICYNMPNKGWGTKENSTKATFETNWYSMGLADPYSISYDNFDVSDHFDALDRFERGEYRG